MIHPDSTATVNGAYLVSHGDWQKGCPRRFWLAQFKSSVGEGRYDSLPTSSSMCVCVLELVFDLLSCPRGINSRCREVNLRAWEVQLRSQSWSSWTDAQRQEEGREDSLKPLLSEWVTVWVKQVYQSSGILVLLKTWAVCWRINSSVTSVTWTYNTEWKMKRWMVQLV